MSAMQNFTKSRLPALQNDEIQLLQGSADFLGLNHYHTWMISRRDYPLNQVSFVADKGNLIFLQEQLLIIIIIRYSTAKRLYLARSSYRSLGTYKVVELDQGSIQ